MDARGQVELFGGKASDCLPFLLPRNKTSDSCVNLRFRRKFGSEHPWFFVSENGVVSDLHNLWITTSLDMWTLRTPKNLPNKLYQTTVDSHVISPDFLRVSSFWLGALITEFCLFWNYATNLHESRPCADRQLQMLQMRWTWWRKQIKQQARNVVGDRHMIIC